MTTITKRKNLKRERRKKPFMDTIISVGSNEVQKFT